MKQNRTTIKKITVIRIKNYKQSQQECACMEEEEGELKSRMNGVKTC